MSVQVLLLFTLVSYCNCCFSETAVEDHIKIPCAATNAFSCLHDQLDHNRYKNRTIVTFQGGQNLMLDTSLVASGIDTLCIHGNGSTITCSGQGTGLSFTNVRNLYVENLHLQNCGLENNGISINIASSTNVTLRDVMIEDSKGSGLALYNTGGQVTIENCTFQNNGRMYETKHTKAPANPKQFVSGRGGGLQMLVGDLDGLHNSSIVVSNCAFKDNYAVGGGGMFIIVQHKATRNNITIENSKFTNNECGRGGGGLEMVYVTDSVTEKNVSENVITVIGCAFDKNKAKYGGGTDFVSTLGSEEFARTCKLEFHDCLWTRNKASVGQAMDIALIPWESFTRTGLFPSPVFANCRFLNHSNVISKLGISKRIVTVTGFDVQFQGRLLFEGNIGSPIFATSSVLNFTANSNAQFINNEGLNGGAIAMRGTTVMFTHENSSFRFEGNKARNRGGALYVKVYNKRSLFSMETCFIQYKGSGTPVDNNVTFVFKDNHAGSNSTEIRHRNTGDSMYITNLSPCLRLCIKSGARVPVKQALMCLGDVSIDQIPHRRHISTEPHHFTNKATTAESDQMCQYTLDTKNYTIYGNKNYNRTLEFQRVFNLHFIPGKNQEIPLKLIDDLCAEVLFHVSVQVVSGDVYIDSANLLITDNRFTLYGKSGDSGVIELSTVGAHQKIQYLNVTLDDCPPGYLHRDKECGCSVNTNTNIKAIKQCNETIFQAYVENGYWLGYFPPRPDNNILASTICPQGFCSNTTDWIKDEEIACTSFSDCPEQYLLPFNRRDDLSSYICNVNRTGILCGRCKENHSAYYHSVSFACRSDELCHLGWLFYILSELIPVTLFFLVVIYFNISFTSGPLNGVIFFMQVASTMKLNGENFISHSIESLNLARIHLFIYRMFSLNTFALENFSFCLWPKAHALDMLAFRYVTIIYSLLLVFATVLVLRVCDFSKRSTHRSRILNLKRSIIHGLSTFLVMTYSECTRVSLMILTCGTINTVDYNSTKEDNINRAFYNGEFKYMGPDHLKYALPAIFFIATLVAIPPLLLMVYPLCYKLFALLRIEESKFVQITCKVIPLEKIKPLFDSIQGAFKDQYRFFAGLYFLYRLCLVVTFAYVSSFTAFYTITGVQLILILGVHAVCRPYKKAWHNILDGILFSNLALINIITFFRYQKTEKLGLGILQHGLVFLPLVYLVLYMVYSIVLRLKRFCVCKRKREEGVVMDDINANYIIDTLDSRKLDDSLAENDTKYVLLKELSTY